MALNFFLFFFLSFIYLFLDRGREGERGGDKHQCVVASHAPPTGDLAHNPGMCPDGELNQRPFGSHTGAQSTEPHQSGRNFLGLVAQYIPTKFHLIEFHKILFTGETPFVVTVLTDHNGQNFE